MPPTETTPDADEGAGDTPANAFTDALAEVSDAQRAYADQLGFEDGRIPFVAESLPSPRVAVRVNQDLLQEVASHILNRAGHTTIIDAPGSGKSHFRELVYQSLRDGQHADDFVVARIRETESITTRRFYARLLADLRAADHPALADLTIPATDDLPHATDEVRAHVEQVAARLESAGVACVVQVDQLEDAARTTRTFEQLLAGLQSVGDLGDAHPVFLLFLFGTPAAGDRLDALRATLSSRLVAKHRSLARFEFAETAELIGRWLAWARGEQYHEGYAVDPFTTAAIQHLVAATDGRPRAIRQQCYHAWRAGAQQYTAGGSIAITPETLDTHPNV